MTGGTGGMKTDEPKNSLGALRKEGHDAAEERMEDWFHEGASNEFEEGEVVRGRVVQVTATEVLVDVGYKSEGDRKSTRLNSSHANISYAVFCLKKKNTI